MHVEAAARYVGRHQLTLGRGERDFDWQGLERSSESQLLCLFYYALAARGRKGGPQLLFCFAC